MSPARDARANPTGSTWVGLSALLLLLLNLGPIGSSTPAAYATTQTSPPHTECPSIGDSPGCEILLVVNPDNTVTVNGDPSVGPYDGNDDTLVGIQNDSDSSVGAVTVAGPGSGLAGFDGDGICSGEFGDWDGSAACPYGSTEYEGPGTSYRTDPSDLDSAEIDFSGGLPPGASTYFSLEGALRSAELTAREGPLSCIPDATTPDYCIPPDWDAHTETGALISGVEPLNVIVSAQSTVPLSKILAFLSGWNPVGIGKSVLQSKCISPEAADVTGAGKVSQQQSWRLGIASGLLTCIYGNILSVDGGENHVRIWNQPLPGSTSGAWFIAASFETACTKAGPDFPLKSTHYHVGDFVPIGQSLLYELYALGHASQDWHCIDGSTNTDGTSSSFGADGYDRGASSFVSDLRSEAESEGWTFTPRVDGRASTGGTTADAGGGIGLGNVAYANSVEVVTIDYPRMTA